MLQCLVDYTAEENISESKDKSLLAFYTKIQEKRT